MIHVTKLNEADMVINCELIEMIESTPDTTVTMNTGRKIIVKEPVNVMLERIIEYKRKINIEGII
ncbi:MAG: flagellar FlbD family protein [Defluviitaleaceae bacterium]|nr:flagellar FlbD family protein [Defluviitaleaceae bacterium]